MSKSKKLKSFYDFRIFNKSENKMLFSSLIVTSLLLFVVSLFWNKREPHKAELRFSENSSISSIIGSVIPASCDASNNYNGDGNYSGCYCGNGAPDYPSCTSITGSCGSANNKIFFPETSPTSSTTVSLCSSGSASSVSGSGPWSWSCSGYYGGSTANCSAQKLGASCTTTTGKKYTQVEFDQKVLAGTICDEGSYEISSRVLGGNFRAWVCKDVARDIAYDNCSYELVAPAVQVQVQ